MTIIKGEYPILDYDGEQQAVIMPGRDVESDGRFPKKAVFLFLADEVDRFARENGCEQIGAYDGLTKVYPIYKVMYRGKEITMCQAPVGAPAATDVMDYLIGHGVCEIIAAGCCGTLIDIPENEFIVPVAALRDEGTSYHYLPPSRELQLDSRGINAVEKTLIEHNLQYTEGKTWTTDAYYRETKDMVTYRKEEGCIVVDMECSALAACAKFRGAVFGQLLFTADTLADPDNHDERGFGFASFPVSLKLALEAVLNI